MGFKLITSACSMADVAGANTAPDWITVVSGITKLSSICVDVLVRCAAGSQPMKGVSTPMCSTGFTRLALEEPVETNASEDAAMNAAARKRPSRAGLTADEGSTSAW